MIDCEIERQPLHTGLPPTWHMKLNIPTIKPMDYFITTGDALAKLDQLMCDYKIQLAELELLYERLAELKKVCKRTGTLEIRVDGNGNHILRLPRRRNQI